MYTSKFSEEGLKKENGTKGRTKNGIENRTKQTKKEAKYMKWQKRMERMYSLGELRPMLTVAQQRAGI